MIRIFRISIASIAFLVLSINLFGQTKIIVPLCSGTASPTSFQIPSTASDQTVYITASSSKCLWSVSESYSWITLEIMNGIGSGLFTFTCSSNSGTSRTALILVTIGNYLEEIEITQAGAIVPPTTPGAITGLSPVCPGSTQTYTVDPVIGATSYNWLVPSGTTIISGQSATSIDVIIGSFAGSISVRAQNSAGNSAYSNKNITLNVTTSIKTHPVNKIVCSGSPVLFSVNASGTGLTYQWRKNGTNITGANSSMYTISSPTSSHAGSYSCVVTGTCGTVTSDIATLTVNPLPTAYPLTGGGSYCSGGTGVSIGISDSDEGISYRLVKGIELIEVYEGTGLALSFGNYTAVGTYTVTAINSTTGCSVNIGSVTVSINALPSSFTVTGGGSLCNGESGVSVGLSGSQTGINYQLKSGTTNIGTAITGTGSVLSFGNQTTTGTYTVEATNATTGCIKTMTGSATVTVNPLPTAYTVTGGGSVCLELGLDIGLSGSQTGVNYQLKRNGVNEGNVKAGTGFAINFGLQFNAGTYTVVASNTSTMCTNTMNGSGIITHIYPPTAYSVTGGGSYCSGESGVSIGLVNTQTDVNYQLLKNGVSIGNPELGTGSSISFGNQTSAGTYTVLGINSSGCSNIMTGSVNVNIKSLPTAYSITGGGSYCSGESGVSIGLNGSQTGISYQLKLNGTTNVGSSISGTGSSISFGNQTTAGNYTILATNSSGCLQTMSGTATITINPLPTSFSVTGGGSYCTGGSGVPVGLNGSDIGVDYLLIRDREILDELSGTGSSISFGNQTAVGTYTIRATNASTGCARTMEEPKEVTLTPNQSPTEIFGEIYVKVGDIVTYSIDPIVGAGSYNWNVPSGVVILSGQESSSILVRFDEPANSISVQAVNECGLSSFCILQINFNPITNTLYAIASGNWSDPSIWAANENGTPLNVIPDKNTNVIIKGYQITLTNDSESGNIELISQVGITTNLIISGCNLNVYGGVHLDNVDSKGFVELNFIEGGSLHCN